MWHWGTPMHHTSRQWFDGSEKNNGLALVANSSFNATFDSKENTTTSHPAELDIAFAGGDGTITGMTTASGSGLTGGGTNGTLNLSLTNACASKQVLQWSGSAWACSNAGSGTITGVTAGTGLSGGGTGGKVTLNNTGLLGLTAGTGIASSGGQTPTLSVSGVPVLAANNAFTGNNVFEPSTTADALDAYSSSPGNAAVVGLQSATSGGSYGVYAITYDYEGAGVSGNNYSSATDTVAAGVAGNSANGFGVYGSGSTYGVYGEGPTGVSGYGATGSGNNFGVLAGHSRRRGEAGG